MRSEPRQKTKYDLLASGDGGEAYINPLLLCSLLLLITIYISISTKLAIPNVMCLPSPLLEM
jgi:hypothetical protein